MLFLATFFPVSADEEDDPNLEVFTEGRHHYNLLWVCLSALFLFFWCLKVFWRLFY